VHPPQAMRASGALLTLLITSAGCSLSADLESLTSGSGEPDHRDADGGFEVDASGVDDNCLLDSCTSHGTSTSIPHTIDAPTTEADDTRAVIQTWDAAAPSSSYTPTPFEGTSTAGDEPSPGATAMPSVTTYPDEETSASFDTSNAQPCTDDSDCDVEGALVHRYSFANVATAIDDSVGGAHGTVSGTATENAGSFVFDGETYIELPTEVLEDRENVTLEVWFTSYYTHNWERIFDVGESNDGSGETYLFLTAQASSADGTMRATFRADGEAEVSIDSAAATSDNLATHVALVFDGAENQLRLYHNGELSASGTTQGSLQDVNVAKVWLGRSLFDSDPLFEGELNEFRIYDGPLSAARVKASFDAGPDVVAE
jgi:Concanavalin A-like lectin/glucanases superfamily